MLAGAFVAAALSVGVFVATLVFGARLFFPTPEAKSTAIDPETPPITYVAPTLIPTLLPSPTWTVTVPPTLTETPAPMATSTPTATSIATTATPPPTPTLPAGDATPTFPAPLPAASDDAVVEAADLPDLVIVWLVPTYVWLDDDTVRVSISVTVRNEGQSRAEGFWVHAYIDDQPEGSLHRASVRWLVTWLEPGDEVRLESELAEGAQEILLSPGDYLIAAEVNGESDGMPPIPESDTGNNTLGPLDLPVGATTGLSGPEDFRVGIAVRS